MLNFCQYFRGFFFFGHSMWHAGSQIPDQGLNPCSLQWKCRVLPTGLLLHSTHCPDPGSQVLLMSASLSGGSLRLGGDRFQKTTPLLAFKTPALTGTIQREAWWTCCFLPFNLDLTIQTKHLQLLTVKTGRKQNLANGFFFKTNHANRQSSLYEKIHLDTVHNSRRLKTVSTNKRA